jgi:hypothetical protein
VIPRLREKFETDAAIASVDLTFLPSTLTSKELGFVDLLNISIKETNTQAAKPEFGNAQFNFR